MPTTVLPEANRPTQLRNCAKWHDRQAKRVPARAKHHRNTATDLRQQAKRLETPTENQGVN